MKIRSDQPTSSGVSGSPMQYLVFLGVFLFIIILALILLTLIIQLFPTPTFPTSTATQMPSTTAIPAITPTLTVTLTPLITLPPTATQTITPTPTMTPTQTSTPTRTPYPSLTPAIPEARDDAYLLVKQSPQSLEYALSLLESYPESIPQAQRGPANQYYYASFYPVILLQSEALSRFPNVPTLPWRIGKAYNLARIGDPLAANEYALATAELLNSRALSLSQLPAWLESRNPGLLFRLIQLKVHGDYRSSHLLAISGRGSAFLLILESSDGYTVTPLTSQLNFSLPAESEAYLSDLNTDGIDEVILWPKAIEGNPIAWLPHIFDVSTMPPRELKFRPGETLNLGMEYSGHWQVIPSSKNVKDLQFQANVFPPCPIKITYRYEWHDLWYKLTETNYTASPASGLEGYCELIVEHAVQVWGLEAATQIMEALLPNWPPLILANGMPAPADARDEWRFRLAMYHALLGHFETATQYFSDLSQTPADPLSRWVSPARQFLKWYQKPTDIYRACLSVETCDTRLALKTLISLLPLQGAQTIVDTLAAHGVTIRSSGVYDFDGDGITERWFTIAPRPQSKLEFWILSSSAEQLWGTFITTIETNFPRISEFKPAQTPPIIQLDIYDTFSLKRIPDTQEPYVVHLPLDYFVDVYLKDGIQMAMEKLFTTNRPSQALGDLLAIRNLSNFKCGGYCARFYTALAMAYELNNNERQAVSNYLYVWRKYPSSPYAILARLRLERNPQAATATSTPTITATPTPSATATETVTPTRTPTP